MHIINTHFGLSTVERLHQARTLLGPSWLGGIDPNEAIVLCGDFNSRAGSATYRFLTRTLTDVVDFEKGSKNRFRTFVSASPFIRIDHVFTNAAVTVEKMERVRTAQAILASDHLPLLAHLQCQPREKVMRQRGSNLVDSYVPA